MTTQYVSGNKVAPVVSALRVALMEFRTPDAARFAQRLNPSVAADSTIIETRLMVNPVLYGDPLKFSLKGHRKMRVGDYGVIYRIVRQDEILILTIGHRKEVYSEINRRLQI